MGSSRLDRSSSAAHYNDKNKIRRHYDIASPYYRSLWGEHLHHGYWIRGDETKEKAQLQLIEHLAQAADIRPDCKILDAGCGLGASCIYLAKQHAADATGITISPIQVEMANQAAARERVSARFLLMDAEELAFDSPFDVIWSVESISHYRDREKFFASATKLLKPGGTFALIDWFKQDGLEPGDYRKFLQPIEEGMMVELQTMARYEAVLRSLGLEIAKREVLNQRCAKTWDLCLDIIKNKALWELAVTEGAEFVTFLRAFRAMRAGFGSGTFVYGLLVAKKS